MKRVAVGLLALFLTMPAQAADADDLKKAIELCAKENQTAIRLACFDLIARMTSEDEKTPEKTAKTADVLKPVPTTEFKRVDTDDIFVAPRKFQDKGIELTGARCYHADLNEYRCIGAGSLAVIIFAPSVSPVGAKSQLEDECGEIRKMATSSKCRKTIRFVPLKISEDEIGGSQKRAVILASSIEVISAPARTRRR